MTGRCAVAALVRASADGQLAAWRARRELAVLAGASPIELAFEPPRRVLYVNPNLWFGLKVGGSVGHIAGVLNGLAAAGYGTPHCRGDPGQWLSL